jgi:hypothetical protein
MQNTDDIYSTLMDKIKNQVSTLRETVKTLVDIWTVFTCTNSGRYFLDPGVRGA